jgi:glutamate/tyrosine decarboxylase-like PLP-dependent enzyme
MNTSSSTNMVVITQVGAESLNNTPDHTTGTITQGAAGAVGLAAVAAKTTQKHQEQKPQEQKLQEQQQGAVAAVGAGVRYQ